MSAASPPRFELSASYAQQLPAHGQLWPPATVPAPASVFFNEALAEALGMPAAALRDDAALWAGQRLPDGAVPFAQAYAGHQFGGFSPSLGDGRALLLGEWLDPQGRRWDLAFKGSGRTPYSRGGDGKAALGPMLREVLIGEHLHALGIPSTRALAVVSTGETIERHDGALPGAVLTRVAASHLRVGTFQYFAARDERPALADLLRYALERHDPALIGHPEPALALLQAVAQRQAGLIAQWMNVGFIHGVMNTDNMTISGESIDFGPCAFLETYDPATVFSSIDRHGRYAYGNQSAIARWNLARLAEALLPLFPAIDTDPEACVAQATAVLDAFPAGHEAALREGQRGKLGLSSAQPEDGALADDFLALLHAQQADFTLAWRALAEAVLGDANPLRARLADPQAVTPWLGRWQQRLAAEARPPQAVAAAIRAASPGQIARNHRVEEALAAASQHGDLAPFTQLLAALRAPYRDGAEREPLAAPAPLAQTQGYRTFCGT